MPEKLKTLYDIELEVNTFEDLNRIFNFKFGLTKQRKNNEGHSEIGKGMNPKYMVGNCVDSFKEVLKQEAVKWVKEIGIDIELIKKSENTEDIRLTLNPLIATITWIKLFFNITEKDLK